MDDLISRQAALEKVRTMQTYKLFMGDDMILVDKAEVQTELMMLPSVQPEVLACGNGELVAKPEPQEGHWIDKGWDGDWAWQIDGRGNCWRLIECSECGKRVLAESNYCPNCGAKMKGERQK